MGGGERIRQQEQHHRAAWRHQLRRPAPRSAQTVAAALLGIGQGWPLVKIVSAMSAIVTGPKEGKRSRMAMGYVFRCPVPSKVRGVTGMEFSPVSFSGGIPLESDTGIYSIPVRVRGSAGIGYWNHSPPIHIRRPSGVSSIMPLNLPPSASAPYAAESPHPVSS